MKSSLAAAHRSQVLVLIGMPGAGKTTVGRNLAATLDLPFADSDDLISGREGSSIRTIWNARGEPAFRMLEHSVIAETLSGHFEGVFSLGGGAVLDLRTRSLLRRRSNYVIYLRAEIATLVSRVGDATSRAILEKNPEQVLRNLMLKRQSIYEELADFSVSADQGTAVEIAAHIAHALRASYSKEKEDPQHLQLRSPDE